MLNSSAYLLFYQREGVRHVPLKAPSEEPAAAAATAVGQQQQQEQQGEWTRGAGDATAVPAAAQVQEGELTIAGEWQLAERQAEQEQAKSPGHAVPASTMLRVDTAPASMAALANGHPQQRRRQQAGYSGSLSVASSSGEEDEGMLATPSFLQPLHPSVSESDLHATATATSSGSAHSLAACQHWHPTAAAVSIGANGTISSVDSSVDDSSSSSDEDKLLQSVNAFDVLAPEEDEAGDSGSSSNEKEGEVHSSDSSSEEEVGQLDPEDAVVVVRAGKVEDDAAAGGKEAKAAGKEAASGLACTVLRI